jgi:hypothetical protein
MASVAAFGASERSSPTTVAVTAGKPSEFKFPLSKKTIAEGMITFR